LREVALYEPSCVKINSVVFPVEDGKKKGKGRYKKSHEHYISPIRGKAHGERIFTKFCTTGDIPNIIICANFGSEKLRGLGYAGVKFWVIPLKWLVTLTTVLAQPVMTIKMNKYINKMMFVFL